MIFSEFKSVSGYDVVAYHFEKRIFVGSPTRSNSNRTIIPQLQSKITELELEDKTVAGILFHPQAASLFVFYKIFDS